MFSMRNEIGAIFKCRVYKESTGELVRETGEFHNVVLNSGLAMMGKNGTTSNWAGGCMVGGGNSEPNRTQTTLDLPIAVTNTRTFVADVSNRATLPYYGAVVYTYRFNAGVAAGNLTEVAIGTRTGNGTSVPYQWLCWNRALIKDVNGNPTTLTILADEFLDVTVEIRVYPQATISGTFQFLDRLGAVISTHNYQGYCSIGNMQNQALMWSCQTLGLYRNTVDNADFKDVTKGMTGTRVVYRGATAANEFMDGDTKMISPVTFGLTEGNDVPINGVQLLYSGVFGISGNLGYKIILDNPITKTNQQEITWRAFIEWGHYEEDML